MMGEPTPIRSKVGMNIFRKGEIPNPKLQTPENAQFSKPNSRSVIIEYSLELGA
jgi:hypothetical protein